MAERIVPTELLDEHLENVLRAAGSSLRHYTTPATKHALRKAMADAFAAALKQADA